MSDRATPQILTVDVEDWYHILEVDGGYTRSDWSGLESRVERNTDRLLQLFAGAGARATFFVVGWVAERHPELMRRITDAGHELGSHSYWHEVVGRHTRVSLEADLAHSKRLLEDLGGSPVRGFRAPGGSITPDTAWAFEAIAAAGYSYDSSTWPSVSSHGGFSLPSSGPQRLVTDAGELVEIPASSVVVAGTQVPYAGGGWLRLFPLSFFFWAARRDQAAGLPVNLYLHPREIDVDQPRMDLPALRRFKYYVGLASTERKLQRILESFRFVSAGEWIDCRAELYAHKVFDAREAIARAPAPVAAPLAPPIPGAGD